MRPDGFVLSAESVTDGAAVAATGVTDTSDGSIDIRAAYESVGACSPSDSSVWVTRALRSSGVEVDDGLTPAAMYEAFCETDSGLDPSLSSLEPGMVVASPHVASSIPSERAFGHCGIYVGNGLVMHDVGVVETIPVREFMGRYGNLVSVGWGWPGRLIVGDGADGTEGTASADAAGDVAFDGASSLPLSYGVTEEALEASVARKALGEIGAAGGARARLVGSWESPDSRSCTLSYVVSDGTGREVGISACLAGDGTCHAVASRFLVVDACTMYDVEEGEYVPIPEAVETEDFSQVRGDFDDMTPEEYLRPFLDPETAIS